jgi:hypothetical protein
MGGPVRIQLSRRKGFKLRETSLAINGLLPLKVDRTTNYGNPYAKKALVDVDARLLVALFRDHLRHDPSGFWKDALPNLRGKNLACWCKPGDPCHADVLLELANAPLVPPPGGGG